MRDTEEMRIWLFDLTHDTGNMSDERIVQGFLKHYAIHGFAMDNVKQDILFHTNYGAENCNTAMQHLQAAMENFVDREESRTLTEVQGIVDAVRAGIPVQVAYYDPDLDDDPFIVRKHW